jgi:molybdopterin-guanine dinucleotide biosynthesis protein A
MNCYVLAGGRSRRMGAPKASIPFAGSTFLERAVDAARGAFDEVFIVVRSGEPVGGNVIAEEPHEDEAPIFGVRRALGHATANCFVLAVDYPLITSEVLRTFRARFESSHATMFVPLREGRPQVLCAGYSHALLGEIDERIARRQYDLRSLTRDAETIDFDGDELMNVNTPGELQEARTRYERQGLLASR